MLVKLILDEFLQEAESTRKLLKAIPDDTLNFKPSEHSWTTGQLALHIAEVYGWFQGVFETNVFDLDKYPYEKTATDKMDGILKKFEKHFELARQSIEKSSDDEMFEKWKMVRGDKTLLGELPRIQVIRGFLMNHIYHHRGEMIVYLRSTGNRVPGLYGSTYDDEQKDKPA
ncbi:DinB family protein [Pedobacter aquatilis]|uniref:DinB family protein n=1 Tax=Pedobacter aquatilis TaxID=351343 RepID=UPI0029305682|nr:DinB family protein [Pedobacter aquatilis]